MHHKRRKPKNARAGCLMCKPHKANGAKGRFVEQTRQERAAVIREREQRREARDLGRRAIRCFGISNLQPGSSAERL